MTVRRQPAGHDAVNVRSRAGRFADSLGVEAVEECRPKPHAATKIGIGTLEEAAQLLGGHAKTYAAFANWIETVRGGG